MLYLFKFYLDICLLRGKPQDIPPVLSMFAFTLAVNLLLDVIVILFYASFPMAMLTAVVMNLVMLTAVAIILALFGYANRILQTLIAYLGTGMVINGLHFPISLLTGFYPDDAAALGFITLCFILWGLTVSAHIMRHALSIHMIPAGVLAIGYLLLNITVFDFLLPQAG